MTLTDLIYNSILDEVMHTNDEYDLIVWKHITEDELTDDNRTLYSIIYKTNPNTNPFATK